MHMCIVRKAQVASNHVQAWAWPPQFHDLSCAHGMDARSTHGGRAMGRACVHGKGVHKGGGSAAALVAGGHPPQPPRTRQRGFGAKKPPKTEGHRPTAEKEASKDTSHMRHAGGHPPHPPTTRQRGTETDRGESNRESEQHSSARRRNAQRKTEKGEGKNTKEMTETQRQTRTPRRRNREGQRQTAEEETERLRNTRVTR